MGIRRFKLNTCWFCIQIVPHVDHPKSLWQAKPDENSTQSDEVKQHLLILYLLSKHRLNLYLLTIYFCCKRTCAEVEVQVLLSSSVLSSLFMALSQSVALTLCLLCTWISFCSCLPPEEPDRVLCGRGHQQHAPALRQYAAWTPHHHYLKQA